MGVVGKIAEEFFIGESRGYREDEISATDEAAFPGLADAAEDFLAIAAGTYGIDAYLEGAKFRSNAAADVRIVASDGRNERTVGDIHFGDEFFKMIDDDDGVQRAEGLGVIQPAVARDVQERGGADVGRSILVGENHAFGDSGFIEANGSFAEGIDIEDAQFFDFLTVDKRAEIELGKWIIRRFDENRITKAQGTKNW